ncbi:hypothetical protein ASD64_17510 [Mesorhizobium sp. Root157]|uniref:hypothetical protein n=1 Tax=Mesorhizobium sp. Root157 TaxID=1736477 RepID=UPI0006F47802|nr:hypothetical protein [Mesorhizobium sp. Root157]KQZ96259.1 hypothetical protein ASD64_17510 [Mesorhizobium sp. Root157]
MNLALKDIRHGLFRFALTCFGLGLLMTVVLAMIGIYNGLVSDALAVVKAGVAETGAVNYQNVEAPHAGRTLRLYSVVDKARRQIGLFLGILLSVSAVGSPLSSTR